ncbi:hypothetical protein B0T26DRAFT_874982 [Lasiosphaeria miniovina]|uniref:DUF6604 domain-containing protein n=1 Tax=Lasiosphaeria miniovina TaxID=1954250 RepID=A0AA40A6A8_9PEZI|nr:uncharacterized protein B0T26DRAFT_874982 [Lasiosphaeria miniovina]KAK0710054.1 hypothetical protein B0T26DRAFT_874982 [Lasiosphaeria miniovina]
MASTNATSAADATPAADAADAADANKPSEPVARDVAQYRDDTKTFEQWLFLVTDEIIRANPTKMKPTGPHIGDHTTRDWAPRSRLVVQFRESVPSYILPTINSAIETRKKVYDLYKATEGNTTHEDRQHLFFIQSLTTSFNILGGREWVRKREARRQAAAAAAAASQDDGWTDASMATKKSRHHTGVGHSLAGTEPVIETIAKSTKNFQLQLYYRLYIYFLGFILGPAFNAHGAQGPRRHYKGFYTWSGNPSP